jgi:carbonic anhydrase
MSRNPTGSPTYNRLLDGVRYFRHEIFPDRREVYEKAAHEPQHPHALIITCSDSRIDPELITQSGPGDIFVTRNIGNVVPPYGEAANSVSAVVEFALVVLGVQDIVVCGHTDCGAMKGLLDPHLLASLPATQAWLAHAEAALSIVRYRNADMSGPATLLDLIEENVLLQMVHLQTYPSIAGRLAQGTLALHGWIYDIGHGDVLLYHGGRSRFISIDEVPAGEPVEA